MDPDSLFDIQVKRFHEYKRQHLNVLHILTLYNRIKRNPDVDIVPRTFIFGGKAAPGYFMAKLIIRLINAVAEVVNRDSGCTRPHQGGFFPQFQRKKLPVDLSSRRPLRTNLYGGQGGFRNREHEVLDERSAHDWHSGWCQCSEIREEVGPENFFLFGLTAKEVYDLKSRGYRARDFYEGNNQLKGVIDLIPSGYFSSGDSELFKPLVDTLLYHDEYLLFADYQSYVDCQDRVSQTYRDQDAWTRMSILNTARMGKFSSDRTIRQYCDEIWRVSPVPVSLEEPDDEEA